MRILVFSDFLSRTSREKKVEVWLGWTAGKETPWSAALNLARSLRTPKFCLRVATASGLENMGCGQQSRTPRLPTPSSIDDNAELVRGLCQRSRTQPFALKTTP